MRSATPAVTQYISNPVVEQTPELAAEAAK
jgi:hypothetical protein